MPIQFQNLPDVRGAKSLLDFAPLIDGFKGYTKGVDNAAANTERLADKGKAEKEARMGKIAARAQAVVAQSDPAKRAAMWGSTLKAFGDTSKMTPEELDPMTGPDLLMAEYGKYQSPIERQTEQAKLGLVQAQTNKLNREPAGGENPSNVREYEYFTRLSPEEQQRYLAVKRQEKYLDLGTGYARTNPSQPGQPMNVTPKDLAGAEAQKAEGEMRGKQNAAAPGDVAAADTALDGIKSIRDDPNLNAGTATYSPLGNAVPKTPGYDFQNKVDQAKSGAFLTAIQQLRGMGSLSNAEGQTATAAVTRMNTSTSKEAFLEALNDYEKLIKTGRANAERRMNQGGQAPPQSKVFNWTPDGGLVGQ